MRPSGGECAHDGGVRAPATQQEAPAHTHGRRLACFRPRRRFRAANTDTENERAAEKNDDNDEEHLDKPPTTRARRLSLGGGGDGAPPRLALACSCEHQTLQCLVAGGEAGHERLSPAATSVAEDLYLYRQHKWSERFAARDWQQERVCQKWKENQQRFLLEQQQQQQQQQQQLASEAAAFSVTGQDETQSVRVSPSRAAGNAVKQALSSFTSAAEVLLHSRQFDALLRAGVPPPLRGRVWWMCSGAAELRHDAAESYAQLLQRVHTLSKSAESDIEKDLPRTFPAALRSATSGTCGASGEDTVGELRRVLQAYALRNPEIGYCQSMNFLAAVLLQQMDEEAAFWVLAAMLEELTPQFHTRRMTGSRAEQRVFADLVAQKLPPLARHLQALGVALEPVTLKWFLCLFLNTLPLEPVLRIWDVFFCEGSHVLLRVGLALLKLNLPRVLACDDALDVYELFQLSHETLRDLTAPYRAGLLNRDECVCDTLLRLAMDKAFLGAIPFDSLHELRQFYRHEVEHELHELDERRRQRAKTQQQEQEEAADRALLLEYDVVDDYAVASGSEAELSPSRHIHFLELDASGDAPAAGFVNVLFDEQRSR